MNLTLKPLKLNRLKIYRILIRDSFIQANFKKSLFAISFLFFLTILVSVNFENYLFFELTGFILLVAASIYVLIEIQYFEKILVELENIKIEQQKQIQKIEDDRTKLENNRETIEKYHSMIIEKITLLGKNSALLGLFFKEGENKE
jgi:hypothetical protein